LLFSACKRSEDGESLILRVYNTAPHEVVADLKLGMRAEVRQANLAERELSGALEPDPATNSYPVKARANEITTFAIRPA
jgi:alpha-mannosidase